MIISSKPQELVGTFQQGGVIAYPTEAVFGLGCDPLNEAAVMRLLEIKQRSIDKGLILIAADFSQVSSFLLPISHHQQTYTQPSETTWIFPATDDAPKWLTGKFDSLAVRISKHPAVIQLCQVFNSALVSTSANLSGLEPAKTSQEVISQLGKQLDGVLDAQVGSLGKPTEIRDSLSGRIVRA